jgi:hypothetical protein
MNFVMNNAVDFCIRRIGPGPNLCINKFTPKFMPLFMYHFLGVLSSVTNMCIMGVMAKMVQLGWMGNQNGSNWAGWGWGGWGWGGWGWMGLAGLLGWMGPIGLAGDGVHWATD